MYALANNLPLVGNGGVEKNITTGTMENHVAKKSKMNWKMKTKPGLHTDS